MRCEREATSGEPSVTITSSISSVSVRSRERAAVNSSIVRADRYKAVTMESFTYGSTPDLR
jgi:hypothetical protein